MKILARNDSIGLIHLEPGDTLHAHYDAGNGSREVGRYEITRRMTIDSLVIVEVEPGELGLSDGIGAIFGTRIK